MEMKEEKEETDLIWKASKIVAHSPCNQRLKKHSKGGKNSKRIGE
jgi:hypothetical protein